MSEDKVFLLYGSTGYFGRHLLKWLSHNNLKYTIGKARIQNKDDLEKEITAIKPGWVLCPAGLKGKPNVDWFEKPENHEEAYNVNVKGRMNVVSICEKLGIHCTVFTTTFIYNYDEKHPMGSKIGFKEDEPPNWDKIKYVQLAIQLEEQLKGHNGVLSLRISMPMSDDAHPGSLLTKLVTFPKVASMPNSFTIIDDLWPFAIKMCLQNVTGVFNFTNPGVISHDEILTVYKEIMQPTHTWTVVPPNGTRPAYYVNTDKLEALFPGQIPTIQDGIKGLITRWKQKQEHYQTLTSAGTPQEKARVEAFGETVANLQ